MLHIIGPRDRVMFLSQLHAWHSSSLTWRALLFTRKPLFCLRTENGPWGSERLGNKEELTLFYLVICGQFPYIDTALNPWLRPWLFLRWFHGSKINDLTRQIIVNMIEHNNIPNKQTFDCKRVTRRSDSTRGRVKRPSRVAWFYASNFGMQLVLIEAPPANEVPCDRS